jgi:hypothetical protein
MDEAQVLQSQRAQQWPLESDAAAAKRWRVRYSNVGVADAACLPSKVNAPTKVPSKSAIVMRAVTPIAVDTAI